MPWHNVIKVASPTYLARQASSGYLTRRAFSSSTSHLTADDNVSSDMHVLRRQERKVLYNLREAADDFVHHAEQIMAQQRSVPSPESLLTPTSGPARYVCTERYAVASKAVELGDALVNHAREIQEHCKDLEHAPYPDIPPQRSTTSEPDFVALRLEEKARKNEVINSLKELRNRAAIIERVIDMAETKGPYQANSYLQHLNDDAWRTTSFLQGEPNIQPAPASENPSPSYSDNRGWDDINDAMAKHLESEEAAFNEKKKRRRTRR
ncbi:hypothetical protein BDV97DRAFT_397299 [Delphinella strobiligena]|nr:hypothetical protein BDV97DRAFT_397299 [Delphinella strobiligena]